MLNISLQQEYIFSIFGLDISNSFFASILVTIILINLAVIFYIHKDDEHYPLVRGVKVLILEILKMIDLVTEDRNLSKKVLPIFTTLFLFIVTANLLALIPGFLGSFYLHTNEGNIPFLKSPNSDLTTTLALTIISVVVTQIFSIRTIGIKKYIKHFINLSNPINFIIGFFEIISETVKLLSFSFRLFGNVFAGEILLLVMAFLIPYVIPVPFMIMEIFVGIIQAFIFAMLTLTFIKMSIINES